MEYGLTGQIRSSEKKTVPDLLAKNSTWIETRNAAQTQNDIKLK